MYPSKKVEGNRKSDGKDATKQHILRLVLDLTRSFVDAQGQGRHVPRDPLRQEEGPATPGTQP